MWNRRHIIIYNNSFRGKYLIQFIIPSKNPCFQLGRGLVPRRFSVAFHSHNNSNNPSNNNDVIGSKGISFLNDSKNMFSKMLLNEPPPSVVKFTQLLDDNDVDVTQNSCSLNHFNQMCATGVPVSNHAAGIAIKCYCRLGQSKLGFSVLGCCFKQGIQPHVSIYNTLLKGFIREDKTHEAERLFCRSIQNRLWEPDVVTYNTMIQGLCKIGNHYTAIALLRLMDHRGVNCKPDILTYNTIIHGLCHDTVIMIDDAFKLFNEMVLHKHLPPNVFTYNSLIYALSKLGRWDGVSRMLEQMQDANISPQLKTFNIVVDALCKQRLTDEAQLVINIMLGTAGKYPPDIVTYNSLIEGYCLRREMTAAKALFDSLPSKSIVPNIATYNYMLDGYIKDLKMREACDLYEDLINKANPIPDVVTFYIMFRVGKLYRDPFKTIGEMQSQAEFPDPNTYGVFLGNLGCHEAALVLFHLMDGSKLNSEFIVYDYLIEDAFKCGKPDSARRLYRHLFLKGLEPSLGIYINMMSGFCREGMIKEATKLHLEILKRNLPPNGIIVNALVEGYLRHKPFSVARILFREMMGKNYRITASNSSLYLDQLAARQRDSKLRDLLLKIKPKDCFDPLDSSRTYKYEMDEPGALIYWGPNIKDPYIAG